MSIEHLVAGTLIDAENPWPGLSSFDEAAHLFSAAAIARLPRCYAS